MMNVLPLGFLDRRGFLRNRRGATAVEFALVAAPFFALILFTLQLSITFFAGQGLETFNETVSRNILTGATQKQNLTSAQFKTLICSSLPQMYSCSRLYVDVQTASAFNLANTGAPTFTFDGAGNVTNSWQYQLGNPGDVVVVRMMYLWPVVSTVISAGLANEANGTRMLMSTAVFKNEQYQ